MKTTALTDKHIALGAKMMDFAGYNMPISYTNLKEEHQTVREGVGMFDVSHMGEFIIRGKEALNFLQKVTTNNVAKLEIGDAQYSCFPNGKGGIVDDLLIYRLPEDQCAEGERSYMLVVNASNIEKDWNWLKQNNTFDATMINISDKTGLLAIQGPKAAEALQILTTTKLSSLKYYTFVKDTFAGIDNVVISATGYTGSGGFELYVDNNKLAQLWDAIMVAGADQGIKPIGLGARDTLRLEMGYCLYGNDIDDTTSPIQAGLGWITKTKKGTDFIDRDLYLKQRAEGVPRKLVGFKVDARRVPRHDYLIEDIEGNEIGKVTSGTSSPSLGYPVGMGYVDIAFSKTGTKIFINVGRKKLAATVMRPPFYKPTE